MAANRFYADKGYPGWFFVMIEIRADKASWRNEETPTCSLGRQSARVALTATLVFRFACSGHPFSKISCKMKMAQVWR